MRPTRWSRTKDGTITKEDASPGRQVTGGVDTHKDSHAVAALDQVGGVLGLAEFAAHPRGYADLLAWLRGFGQVVQVG